MDFCHSDTLDFTMLEILALFRKHKNFHIRMSIPLVVVTIGGYTFFPMTDTVQNILEKPLVLYPVAPSFGSLLGWQIFIFQRLICF